MRGRRKGGGGRKRDRGEMWERELEIEGQGEEVKKDKEVWGYTVEEKGRERDLKELGHPIEFKYWDKNIYSEA